MRTKLTLIALAATMLTACGGTIVVDDFPSSAPPPPPPTAADPVGFVTANGDGTFTVTQASRTTNLPVTNVMFNGQASWSINTINGSLRANSYNSPNVSAIGGMQANQAFAGITGTTTTVPPADATFVGRYAVNTLTVQRSGPLTLSYDIASGTIADVGSDLDVVATASGGALTGTVTFEGASADLSGGFYGTDEITGAFNGTGLGGIVYGTK